MDNFYKKNTCDRCGGSLENGRTMSMFSTECICKKCKEEERYDPQYQEAVQKERTELLSGNMNFPGIRGKK